MILRFLPIFIALFSSKPLLASDPLLTHNVEEGLNRIASSGWEASYDPCKMHGKEACGWPKPSDPLREKKALKLLSDKHSSDIGKAALEACAQRGWIPELYFSPENLTRKVFFLPMGGRDESY